MSRCGVLERASPRRITISSKRTSRTRAEIGRRLFSFAAWSQSSFFPLQKICQLNRAIPQKSEDLKCLVKPIPTSVSMIPSRI